MIKYDAKKEIFCIFITLVASVLSAFGLYFFVYPASFAPAGVDGIATMLQEITRISAGYFSLLINIPLLIFAWFILKRRFVIYTVVFTLVSSLLLVLFDTIGFPQYVATTDKLISAVFSGIILGVRTGLMLKLGASTGGVDVVAAIVQKNVPMAILKG